MTDNLNSESSPKISAGVSEIRHRHVPEIQIVDTVRMEVCTICGKQREDFATRGGNQREWRAPFKSELPNG